MKVVTQRKKKNGFILSQSKLGLYFFIFFPIWFWVTNLHMIWKVKWSSSLYALRVIMVRGEKKEMQILMKSQKFIFTFVSFAFGDISWKKLLWLIVKRLLPIFSSRILMDACLTLRSFIHLEFIFVDGVWNGRVSFFSIELSSIPSTIYWRECLFSQYTFPCVVEHCWAIELRVHIWALYSVPLVYVSVLMPGQTKGRYPESIKNSWNSTHTEQTIISKKGQKTWTDTSPMKTYKWLSDTWNKAHHH